ncbi:UPF0496 protein At4g34320-like [Cryptomeria japonica]|uniref:UPF0496 protein At4g34320-like n=1 Tax=Cryptomeria japonica TaxID=3369 RepID=UPI0027DA2126|nr:UPF0496 protein At4g34320-like [Cryptomeria japonica]
MIVVKIVAFELNEFGESHDGQVIDYIIERGKYTWKDEETREVVDEYFINSRETSSFFVGLQLSLVKAKIYQRNIGVALQGITPEKPLSDAQYRKVKKKFKDYKMAENPFKDFEKNIEPLFERHKQLLKKLKNKMKEFEEEELQMEELHEQLLKNQTEEELKPKSRSKYWSVWKVISVATAAAVVALSVAAVVFVPIAPVILMAPEICTISCSIALTVCGKRSKDKTVANEAEKKREEAEKKRAEAKKKITEAKKIIDTVDRSMFVTMQTLDEAKCSKKGLIVVITSINGYIDICLEDKENVLSCVDEINKEQKRFVNMLDRLQNDVGKYCDGLHERREALTRMIASYI